jgi:hypothetical protein
MAMYRACYRLYLSVMKTVHVPTGGTGMTTEAKTDADRIAIGERLGFYEVMSETPVTEAELAERTGAPTSLVVHWLAHQLTEGYVAREVATGRYANWCSLPLAA